MLDKLYNRKDTGMSWTPKGEVPKRLQRAAEGSLEVCFIVPMTPWVMVMTRYSTRNLLIIRKIL